MAHEFQSGFFVKQAPWHNLGKVIQQAPSIQEGIITAGLDWSVERRELFTADGQMVPNKAIVRTDTNKVLSVVGPQYHPLQNIDAFNFFQPFLDANEAKLETAGSLRDGNIIWVLAKLNREDISVGKDDTIAKYLLLSNGHDGNRAVRVSFTPIRVVCMNTLKASDKNSSFVRIFHSKQVKENLLKVQEIVNAADSEFQATEIQYKALTKKKVSQEDLKKFVKVVFFDNRNIESERTQMAYGKMVETITRLFETGKGSQLKTAKGTMWGLYNAATEYLSWEQAKTEEQRFSNLWFGYTKQTNEKAFQYAMGA